MADDDILLRRLRGVARDAAAAQLRLVYEFREGLDRGRAAGGAVGTPPGREVVYDVVELLVSYHEKAISEAINFAERVRTVAERFAAPDDHPRTKLPLAESAGVWTAAFTIRNGFPRDVDVTFSTTELRTETGGAAEVFIKVSVADGGADRRIEAGESRRFTLSAEPKVTLEPALYLAHVHVLLGGRVAGVFVVEVDNRGSSESNA